MANKPEPAIKWELAEKDKLTVYIRKSVFLRLRHYKADRLGMSQSRIVDGFIKAGLDQADRESSSTRK